MSTGKLLIPVILFTIITGCADNPPKNLDNICSIYKEKRYWYKASLNTERKWGVPPQIPMAFIHQESKYNGTSLPPRKYILWIIPWGRVSSSYGFAQAQTPVWNEYIKDTGNSTAKRNNFADSIDFIVWIKPIELIKYLNGILTANISTIMKDGEDIDVKLIIINPG